MEPISLSALVALITQAAAGEAGKGAGDGLIALVRRAIGHGSHAQSALDRSREGDQSATLDLAGRLVQGAAADPEFDHLLRAWMAEVQRQSSSQAVLNGIGGNARIHGDVVQAGQIGTVNLGRGPGGTAAW